VHLVAYSDAVSIGGAEISLRTLLSATGAELRVTVMGVDRDVVRWIADARADVATVIVPRVRSKWTLRAVVAHIRAVLRLRPDVLQVNLQTPWAGQYAVLAGLLVPGVRTVAVEHCPMPSEDDRQRRLKRLTSRRLSAHVAVGDRLARLVEEFAGLPGDAIRTIYNPVPDVTDGVAHRSTAGPVVGYVGRLDGLKGLDVLIRAMPRLPDATVVLVGDGPARHELAALAEELGVGNRLVLTGWTATPRAHLKTFDIFAIPSRLEGYPIAIVEAMLAGLPVVGTRVGGIPEAVTEGKTGLIVEPDDISELEAAIAWLLDDPDRATEMGRRGRAFAVERHRPEVIAQRYASLYAEILGVRSEDRFGAATADARPRSLA